MQYLPNRIAPETLIIRNPPNQLDPVSEPDFLSIKGGNGT